LFADFADTGSRCLATLRIAVIGRHARQCSEPVFQLQMLGVCFGLEGSGEVVIDLNRCHGVFPLKALL
jgi:hypothetical protein